MKFPTLRRRPAPQTPRRGIPPTEEALSAALEAIAADRERRSSRYPKTCEHGVHLSLCPLCSPIEDKT